MKAVSRAYRSFCHWKTLDFRAEEDGARKDLSKATIALQANLDDHLVQNSYGATRLYLQDVETRKVVGQRIRVRIRWKLRGDMVSAEFFKAIREKPASSAITSLRNSLGVIVDDSKEMSKVCSEFYSHF